MPEKWCLAKWFMYSNILIMLEKHYWNWLCTIIKITTKKRRIMAYSNFWIQKAFHWQRKIATNCFQQCYQPGKEDEQDEEEAWMACAEDYECSQECLKVGKDKFLEIYWFEI